MAPSLRIGMLAGEASGDALGAGIIRALAARGVELRVEGIGGPRMQDCGMHSLYPMERLAVMGLVDPLKRLPDLLRIRRRVFEHFRRHPPDLFLGIDSPDFNLGLERRLRRRGVPTAHLVSPSVWAWRGGRIRGIRRSVDLMLCLFPFETDIYEAHGVPVRYVGHPLADEIDSVPDRAAARAALGLALDGPVLALLPGSRAGEIRQHAPLFLAVAQQLWDAGDASGFLIPAADAARHAELQGYLAASPELPVILLRGQAREAMAAADAVLLASGTATLEAALLRRPMVVAYRMHAASWAVMSRLLRAPYVALPNLLAGRALVPELLQAAATPAALCAALRPLLAGDTGMGELTGAFRAMHTQLRVGCADRVAAALLQLAGERGS
jgi:lipid-A-disaccharide synthase